MSEFTVKQALYDKITPKCALPKASETKSKLLTIPKIQELLTQNGYSEEEIDDYLYKYNYALSKYKDSDIKTLINLQKEIRYTFNETRDSSYIEYPLEVVITVCILAFMSGAKSPIQVADFYKENNATLQVLIPNMPPPNKNISYNTVRTILTIVDPNILEKFFIDYFGNTTALFEDLYKAKGLKRTLAFDGQEVRASYKKGESSRNKKGAIVTSICDCSNKSALSYAVTDKKNKEKTDFINMLFNVNVQGSVIMSDALNTTRQVRDSIIKAKADFLMPIKSNNKNKELLEYVTKAFVQNSKSELMRVSSSIEKAHGRIESSYIYILPVSVLPIAIEQEHYDVKTIVKYLKIREKIGSGKEPTHEVRYYISSLDFNDETILEQIVYSIDIYWNIEAMHNRLDVVFMQDSLNICDENYLPNRIGFNKIVFNIITYQRELLSKGKKEKISYERIMRSNISNIYNAFKMLCKYFIDCNKKYPPMQEVPKRIKNLL